MHHSTLNSHGCHILASSLVPVSLLKLNGFFSLPACFLFSSFFLSSLVFLILFFFSSRTQRLALYLSLSLCLISLRFLSFVETFNNFFFSSLFLAPGSVFFFFSSVSLSLRRYPFSDFFLLTTLPSFSLSFSLSKVYFSFPRYYSSTSSSLEVATHAECALCKRSIVWVFVCVCSSLHVAAVGAYALREKKRG